MAIIKKKIENLKPGKEYVLTVRAKNSDLNVLSDYSDSIRFQVPNDATTPSALTSLQLFAGLENVMFVFDYSQDLDVRRYEYELYENEDMSDEDGPLTGFADANVFTVRVSNLQLEEDGGGLAPFWGRVRTIDTTGNVGPWTSLVQTDPHTPLIDNQYIGSLTVSKLTAGTIGSHTINLNGINSIIQSTTYQDTLGAQGWQIRGDGHFSLGGPNGITYDNDSITIGSDVSVTATLAADSIIVGTVPNQLKINGAINSGAGGMTLGDPTNNYWYSNGRFRVGSASKYMQWNGTDLSVTGTINATAGYFSGDITIGSGPGSTTLNAIEASSIDFNSRNNRNSTTPTNPTINSDGTAIDHVINGNGSADISFEWNYTYTDVQNAANNIDGFVVYVYSSDSSTPYTFGDNISFESTYPVDSDRRAIVLSGVSANKYYTFGIKAYRVVDRDISASEILYSSIVQPTRTEEKPYRPSSTIAFTGDITGTINGTAAATVVAYATAGNTVATNFNNNNDRNGTTPPIPTIPTNGTAIDHVLNTDGSVDVTFLWNEYSASNGVNDSRNIDGFIVYVRSSTSATSYTFGTTPAQETTYYLPRDKKVFILPGVAADKYYNFGIRAYRMVDTTIPGGSEGIIYSLIAQSAGAGENPYRPENNVAFNGNITGFINGIAAATVIERANAGNTVATNFNNNNDRNTTTPTAPTLPSSIVATSIKVGSTYTILDTTGTTQAQWNTTAGTTGVTYGAGSTFTAVAAGAGTGTVSGETIDHVVHTDGSVDISFEWLYTNEESTQLQRTTSPNNIDGFIVYVRSSTNSSAYSFGSLTYEETTYYLPRDKRAFVLPAVAADRYYTFGVRAYRMVDTDLPGCSEGILYSTITKSVVTGENPYRPQANVAFGGDITGTVGGTSVNTLITYATAGNTVASNFNSNNDRNSTKPQNPTLPNTITAGSFRIGNTYTIANISGSTQAQWNAAAGTTGITYSNNSTFTAATVGAGTGTVSGETIDHTLNTDGSANISFEWIYTVLDSSENERKTSAQNIDGFIIYVRSSSTDAAAYTFGTKTYEETTYYVARDQRVFVLDGVPANLYYTFGVSAYRMVDTDIDPTGIKSSDIVKSTLTGENPYRPSATVAFAGDITGTVNSMAVATLIERANAGNTVATNFNINNDRNALIPTSPVIPSNGIAIDHTINTDGSADISFEWTYTVSDTYNVANNIDGFIVYVRSTSIVGATPSSFTFGAVGNDLSQETTYYLPREKKAFVLPAVAADRYYNFGVRAYRMVDTDLPGCSEGILYSPIVQPSYGGELFYQPSTTVAFAGNITGTVNSVAVTTITTTVSNFNDNNDSISTTPATPTSVAFSTATSNTNASIDLPLNWTYTNSSINISSASYQSGFATSTYSTSTPHGFTTGNTVTVAGITPSSWNRTATITVTSPTSFFFSLFNGSTGGAYSSGGSATNEADAYDIDGFVVFLRTSTDTDTTSITTSDLNNNIQQVFLTAEKRSHTFSGISPSSFYRAAVRAYRVVYTHVNSAGVIYGPLVNTTERSSAIATLGGSSGIKIGDGKIYIGTNPGAFNNSNTGFYVDSISQFSLGNKLKWGDLTNAGSFTVGKSYSIVSLGNTTQAQWNTAAGTTGMTYAVGSVFTAATVGAGSGTASLQQLTIAGDVLIGSTPGSTIASGAASGSTSLQPGGAASDVNNNTTTISGSKIRTGVIESTGYTYSSGNFSTAGMQIDLGNGVIRSKNFGIDSSGNAFFNGQVTAISGILGGWNIGIVDQNGSGALSGALYNGSGASLSAIAPGGWAWFSSRIITPLISGYGSGTKSSGGVVADMFLRNIQYGGGRPSGGSIGDIYLS